MLSTLRSYLAQQGSANLAELACHCGSEPEAVRSMLGLLMRKGQVQQRSKPLGCGSSCTLCRPEIAMVYEWRYNKKR